MADLDRLIQEGFARGVAGFAPADRWDAIAAALDGAPARVRRGRSPWLPAAAAVTAAALLSLLYPPVRAAAVEGIMDVLRIVLKVRWEGRVGDAPAAIMPLPGEDARPVGDPERALLTPAVTKHEVVSLDEAAAIAGFTPPAPSDPAATPTGYEVTVLATPGLAESRIVTVRYYYKGQIYTLTAKAGFAADEAGQWAFVPQEALLSFSPLGEALGGVEKVDLGGAEALCLTRDFGTGQATGNSYAIGECTWLADGVQVSVTGPDVESVIEFARLLTGE